MVSSSTTLEQKTNFHSNAVLLRDDFLRTIKEMGRNLEARYHKISDAASNVFYGIRSVGDLFDPRKVYFSPKTASALFFSSAVDVLLFPYKVSILVHDVKRVIYKRTLKALFTCLVNTKSLVQDGATVCTLLHRVKVLSEDNIKWVTTFNVVALIIDCGVLIRTSLVIFQISRLEKNLCQEKTTVNLLKFKIQLLKQVSVSESDFMRKIGEIQNDSEKIANFSSLLQQRLQLQKSATIAELVNSAVSCLGNLFSFFPPLVIPSTVLLAVSGLGTVVLWAGKERYVSRINPFQKPFTENR